MRSFIRILVPSTLTLFLIGFLISASGNDPSEGGRDAKLASGDIAAVYWRETDQGYTGLSLKSRSRKPAGSGYSQQVERGEVTGEIYDHWVRIVHKRAGRDIWIPSSAVIPIEFAPQSP